MDGSRTLFNEFWSAKVPPKVRIFAWKLAQNGLATNSNRKSRNLIRDATCQICGRAEETGHHAVVCCTKAFALRQEMRRHWLLHDEQQFRFTGPDWHLILLASIDDDLKAKTLLLFWRAWHLRNNAIHSQGTATIMGSALFLYSYGGSIKIASQLSDARMDGKGKEKVWESKAHAKITRARLEEDIAKRAVWKAPPQDWIKINTDAGFCSQTGTASIGVIARGHSGEVILTTWKFIRRCGSPEEAEAEACLEGIRLAVEWIRQPVCAETDCYGLAKALQDGGQNRARWAGIISGIMALSNLLPACSFGHVRREANQVAHQLGRRALERHEWVVMRHDMPEEVRSLVIAEAAGEVNLPLNCNWIIPH
jgi:ribonuclease HI